MINFQYTLYNSKESHVVEEPINWKESNVRLELEPNEGALVTKVDGLFALKNPPKTLLGEDQMYLRVDVRFNGIDQYEPVFLGEITNPGYNEQDDLLFFNLNWCAII